MPIYQIELIVLYVYHSYGPEDSVSDMGKHPVKMGTSQNP